jgi:hypothetical protein
MKPTLWGLMALILSIASTALADYNDYDARGNYIGRVKSPYSVPPWLRTDSTGYAAPGDNAPQTETEAPAAEEGSPSAWTGAIGGGIAPTAGGFDSSYSVGYGLEANVGLKLNSHWDFLLMLDAYSFSSTFSGWSANQFDLLPSLRYSFGGENGIRPYLFAGVGGNDNLVIESDNSTINGINLAVAAGIGVAIPIASHLDIFIQGKYSVNFTLDGSFSYIPVSAGLQFN